MPVNKSLIKIDYTRDSLFPEIALKTLQDRYLADGETSPQEALARASAAFADDLEHAQRLYDYASKHWFMFSTPILSNGGTNKGLGISCFGGYVEDSIGGITNHYTESTFLSTRGGGLGGYWGAVRSSGKKSKSNGMISFMRVMDAIMLAANQTDTRRGSYAAQLPIWHPEIEEYIDVRDPSGDHSRRCLGIGFHHAICIDDKFMQAVEDDTHYALYDPHSLEVTKTVRARELWQKILNTRRKTGEPYLVFVDAANRAFPANLKAKGLSVKHSQLCNEIFLHSGPDYAGKNRTFICCLSSVNHAKFDEWEPFAEQMYEDLVRMLDNVLDHFIENAPEAAEQAIYSARMTRDLGVGAMGFHTYLQSKMIPFESQEAADLNNKLFYIHNKYCIAASEKLGEEKGFYPDAYDAQGNVVHRQRNANVSAIAPNASSGIICGNVSPSIEPWRANAFKQTNMSGSFYTVNPILVQLLEDKGKNTEEVWKSIVAKDGSVQHLDFLSDEEKLVFKTFFEIDQRWVVKHAGDRQPYLCQGQSLNVAFDHDIVPLDLKHFTHYMNEVHRMAWRVGLKGMYYMKNRAQKADERVGIVKARQMVTEEGCLACEG